LFNFYGIYVFLGELASLAGGAGECLIVTAACQGRRAAQGHREVQG